MEVCRPQLIWINGACYRKGHQGLDSSHDFNFPKSGDVMDEYEDEIGCPQDGINECQYEIISTQSKFSASFHVASAFFPILIGKKGSTKKRIESETQTRISIPKQGVENEDIIVTGESKFAVANACHRIDVIVANARKRQGFTHFISIPVNQPQMQEAFTAFKKAVIETCQDVRGLDESIFQTETLLHLTIGTLALMDETERAKAADMLKAIAAEGQNIGPIKVKGLEIMNDDPGEVDVIYGKVSDCEDLQLFADKIVDKFAESGLMNRQYDRVKLHVTLLNTLFRKKDHENVDNDDGLEAGKCRETMDSRPILELFGDHDFAVVDLKEIHLSQRRAGKRTKENYYFPTAIVQLV